MTEKQKFAIDTIFKSVRKKFPYIVNWEVYLNRTQGYYLVIDVTLYEQDKLSSTQLNKHRNEIESLCNLLYSHFPPEYQVLNVFGPRDIVIR
jgi:hypothetical protein